MIESFHCQSVYVTSFSYAAQDLRCTTISIRPDWHMQIRKKGALTHQFGHCTEMQMVVAHTRPGIFALLNSPIWK